MRIAAEGIQAAQRMLDVHAHNVANVSTEGSASDLAGDVVGLIVASTMYKANARAFEVLADAERYLLDVRA